MQRQEASKNRRRLENGRGQLVFVTPPNVRFMSTSTSILSISPSFTSETCLFRTSFDPINTANCLIRLRWGLSAEEPSDYYYLLRYLPMPVSKRNSSFETLIHKSNSNNNSDIKVTTSNVRLNEAIKRKTINFYILEILKTGTHAVRERIHSTINIIVRFYLNKLGNS